MKKVKNIARFVIDIIEIWIPIILLLSLFVAFVLGVVFRYALNNPQSWTYEISSITFLSFVMLSACYVQRTEKHIVFDMVYNKISNKAQCIMRIISNFIVTITCAILTPVALEYVLSMKNLTSQILKIPRGAIFVCFVILFFSTTIRTVIRFILDAKAYKNKTYTQAYAIEKEANE